MSNAVLKTFETYQKSRVQFVQTVAELAKRKENFEALQSAGALLLLRPLLLDVVPSVAQTACIAIERMATESPDIADSVANLKILPEIIYSIADQNRFFKKCAAFVLRAVAKHSAESAKSVVDADGLQALNKILSEFDPSVKEAGCWAISYIAKHSIDLANEVVEVITIEKIAQCVQEPELALKRIATYALTQIAKHSSELAKQVAKNTESMLHLVDLLKQSKDYLLKRQIIACFSHIASHNQELTDLIWEKGILSKMINLLKDNDQIVRVNTAECIKNIVKHSKDCAKIVCDLKGHTYLLQYLEENGEEWKEYALDALTNISDFDEILAKDIMKESTGGINIIRKCLVASKDPKLQIKACRVWGSWGRHSEDHSLSITSCDVLDDLLEICSSPSIRNDDLKKEAIKSINLIIQNSKNLEAVHKLINPQSPSVLIVKACKQIQKIIENISLRKEFFAKKYLKSVVDLKNNKNFQNDSNTYKALNDVCNMYPKEIIDYFNPDFEKMLAKQSNSYNIDG